ncbi:GL18500 [Drosophila persimilis]|uniref:Membrane magnesium transporter n=2 Tax=pseudoobscura subgroup TaxID=32358 RepID=Q29LU3_DROPS|nr:membrane magnesium transporter 1 [Drosophila pseudoobscura]XP_002015286.1 membrane magnesium transporter 1 [Drosophila persimilis]EDW29282.1 GL18500 [Drosophila persimilis]
MGSTFFNKLLLIAGFASLAHAAFSAAHHRTYLRLTEQEWNSLPLDIILQTVISLVVVVYNIIEVVGHFKEIRATVDMQQKTWDTLGNFPSFYSFNHRGRALNPGYTPSEKVQ